MTYQTLDPYTTPTYTYNQTHAAQPLITASPAPVPVPVPIPTPTNPTSPSSRCSCFSGFMSSFLILLLLASAGCGIATLRSSTWFTYRSLYNADGSYYTVGPFQTCYYSQNYFSECYRSSCAFLNDDYNCIPFKAAQVLQVLGVSLSFLAIIPMIVTHFVISLRAKFVCRLIASIALIVSTSTLIATVRVVNTLTETLNTTFIGSPAFAFVTGAFTLSIVSTALSGFTTFLYIVVAIHGHKKDQQALRLPYVPLCGTIHYVQDQQPNPQVYLQPSYAPPQQQHYQIPKYYPQVRIHTTPSQNPALSETGVVHYHHPHPQTSTLVHPQPYA